MATYYNHAQIGIVDANGNVNVIYPKTVGADVSVDPSAHCAAGTTVQKVISNLGSAAFSSLSNSYNDSPSASDGYTQSVINSKITELNNKLVDVKSLGRIDLTSEMASGSGSAKVLALGKIAFIEIFIVGTMKKSGTSVTIPSTWKPYNSLYITTKCLSGNDPTHYGTTRYCLGDNLKLVILAQENYGSFLERQGSGMYILAN